MIYAIQKMCVYFADSGKEGHRPWPWVVLGSKSFLKRPLASYITRIHGIFILMLQFVESMFSSIFGVAFVRI